jgi:hypothetical protein
MRHPLWFIALLFAARVALAGSADITVDVGKNTVDPEKPVARMSEDGFLLIQILDNGNRPAETDAQLRFGQRVFEQSQDPTGVRTLTAMVRNKIDPVFTLPGTAHHLRLMPCNRKSRRNLKVGDRKAEKADCPLIVSNGSGTVTIIADNDSVPLIAEITSGGTLRSTPISLRTVRPVYGLTFSTGPAFFAGDQLRDEKYRFEPIANDASTSIDESLNKKIVAAGNGEAAYELGIFATYMFERYLAWQPVPLGITFGFSAKIPVQELTVASGLSWQIKPFPVTDSAFVTVGVAYRAHDRLLPKYRGMPLAPVAVTEDQIVGKEHDVGLFIAISFAFAGGGREQFKKVVAAGQ